MKLIDYAVNTGKYNMDYDESLLDSAIESATKEPIFRLYGWSPACISLGRNQNDSFINTDIMEKHNIDVVKRLTGGRALLHDNELTYSCIVPIENIENGQSVKESYKQISQILIDVFKEFDINLSFGGGEQTINTKSDYCMLLSTGADLCYEGKKFIGSAQCRKQGYILQHGSILLDYNDKLLYELFNEPISESKIISLSHIRPELSLDEVIDAFKEKIRKTNYLS